MAYQTTYVAVITQPVGVQKRRVSRLLAWFPCTRPTTAAWAARRALRTAGRPASPWASPSPDPGTQADPERAKYNELYGFHTYFSVTSITTGNRAIYNKQVEKANKALVYFHFSLTVENV